MSATNDNNRIIPAAFTIEGFCAYAAVGRSRAYELLNNGALPARKSGGRTLILREDADAYLANLPRFTARRAK